MTLTFQWLTRVDRFFKTTLFELDREPITLLWILQLIVTLVVVIVLATLLKRFLRDRVLVPLKLSQGNREAISTLVAYGAGTIAFLAVLAIYGLNLASLAVVMGGLGVGIGFGLQELTKNLVSGLTLLVERKLQVGDYVEFGGLSGYIKEIAMRSTVIRTFDGGDVIVPNSNLISNEVLNWSYQNFTGKIHIAIGVAYDSDPILVTETLLDSAYMEPSALHDPPPKVLFKGFGDNALEFELWVWVSRIDEGITVRSSLNFIIDYNFRRAGIKIPFPQREIWFHPSDQSRSDNTQANGVQSDSVQSDSVQSDGVQSDGVKLNGQPSNGQKSLSSAFGFNDMPQPVSIRQLLRQVPYFQHCSDLRLREIIETGYRKQLEAAEILFHEGEIGTAFYIILSGSIETVVVRLGNKQVRVYQAGELFGEAPVMLNLPYQATARTLEETSVMLIHKNNFEKLLRSRTDLAELLSQELLKEQEIYAEVRQQLQDMGLLDINMHHHGFVDWVQLRLKQLFNT